MDIRWLCTKVQERKNIAMKCICLEKDTMDLKIFKNNKYLKNSCITPKIIRA